MIITNNNNSEYKFTSQGLGPYESLFHSFFCTVDVDLSSVVVLVWMVFQMLVEVVLKGVDVLARH